MLFLLALLLVPIYRQNALLSFVTSEIILLVVLWVLWLALVILTQKDDIVYYGDYTASLDLYNELLALRGLSISTLVVLKIYLLTLTIYALVKHANGTSVWKRSVKELEPANFPLAHNSGSNSFPMSTPLAAAGSFTQAPYSQPIYVPMPSTGGVPLAETKIPIFSNTPLPSATANPFTYNQPGQVPISSMGKVPLRAQV